LDLRVRGDESMRQTLIALLEPGIVALGYELVELEFNAHRGGGTLRIYIDHPGGETEGHRITVDDCEAVSRMSSELLDAADPIRSEYTLEVSSPGFDRPLAKPAHFARVVGGRVHVESHLPRDGRRRWTGELVATSETGIELKVDGKEVILGFNEIKTARLVPDFGTRRE
jgi:ribosome maturation factor RimP